MTDPESTPPAASATARMPVTKQVRALTLGQLVIRVLLLLPICYVAWHYAGGMMAALFAPLVEAARKLFLVGKVGAFELSGAQFIFPLRADAAQFEGRAAELLVEINSRIYTFGAPVFVAVMLAARARLGLLLLGLVLLLPFQAWGVFFELLKDLSVRPIQGIPVYPELDGLARESIIVAYQFGALILPVLAPVTLAAIFAKKQITEVVFSNIKP
jgi:hypothetical protein